MKGEREGVHHITSLSELKKMILEFQADKFAAELGYGEKLKSSLLVLTKDDLSFPTFDWLYSLFNLTHPTVTERFDAIGGLHRRSN